MFDIFIDTHFAGAHHLRDYPGECEKPHGHNWKVKVTVRATVLDRCGMGIDFKVLKATVKESIDKLDHRDLNEHPAFHAINPSSEHIAMFLFESLKDRLQTERYRLYSVEVRETDTSGVVEFIARYREADAEAVLQETSRFVRETGRWTYVDAL